MAERIYRKLIWEAPLLGKKKAEPVKNPAAVIKRALTYMGKDHEQLRRQVKINKTKDRLNDLYRK